MGRAEDFQTRHPGSAENGAHPCAPPLRGLARAVESYGGKQTLGQRRWSVVELLLLQPGDREHIRRPGGRRTGCAAFSDRTMDGESENPLKTRLASVPCRGSPLSLLTFFAGAKKVSHRRRKPLPLDQKQRGGLPPLRQAESAWLDPENISPSTPPSTAPTTSAAAPRTAAAVPAGSPAVRRSRARAASAAAARSPRPRPRCAGRAGGPGR